MLKKEILSGSCEFQKKRFQKNWEKAHKAGLRPVINVSPESLSTSPFQKDFFADERAFVIHATEKNKNFIKNLKSQIDRNSSDFFLIIFQGKINPKDWMEEKINDFEPPDFSARGKLIKELAAEKNLIISQELERFILERFEADFFLIDNAFWTLSQNFSDQKIAVTEQNILDLLPGFLGSHVFKIFTYLQKGDFLGAEIFVTQLLERGESELAILGMLTKFAKDTISAGRTAAQTKKYRQALNLCGELDLTFKSQSYGAEFGLRQIFAVIS